VTSSLAVDDCFPLLIFRRPKTPHTRIPTHRTLSTIRPPELSHGIEKKFRIAGPSPKWRALSEGLAAKGELEFYNTTT
jgi:hypothetical protein